MKLRWSQQARFNCWPTLLVAAMLVLTTNVRVCGDSAAAVRDMPFMVEN